MSNGVLGKAMSQNGVNVTPYTVPAAAKFATISIALTNLGTTVAKAKVAIGLAATPGTADYIEFGADIPANGGILERNCIVCSANEKVIIEADSNDLAIRIYGLEQL